MDKQKILSNIAELNRFIGMVETWSVDSGMKFGKTHVVPLKTEGLKDVAKTLRIIVDEITQEIFADEKD